MAVLPRSDVAVVGVKVVVAVACSMLVALVSRDSQHMQVAVSVRLMWTWSKGGQVGSVVVKMRVRSARSAADDELDECGSVGEGTESLEGAP